MRFVHGNQISGLDCRYALLCKMIALSGVKMGGFNTFTTCKTLKCALILSKVHKYPLKSNEIDEKAHKMSEKPPKQAKKSRKVRGIEKKGIAYKTHKTRVRAAISSLIDQDFTLDELRRLIDKVERDEGAKAAFTCYTTLLDYVLPKLQRVEHTGKDGDALSLKHILDNVSQTQTHDKLPTPELDVIDMGKLEQEEPQGRSKADLVPSYAQNSGDSLSVDDFG